MIAAAVQLPEIGDDWTMIATLLDTGAASTTIHPYDAERRIGIDKAMLEEPSAWARRETYHGIGGSSLCFVTPIRYAFFNDRDDWEFIEGQVRIAQRTGSNVGLPSILGWDILRRFAITLDWSQKIVELR